MALTRLNLIPRRGALTAAICLMLVACGGGGSGGDGVAPAPAAPAPSAIQGTVATGAALAGAEVRITDRVGAVACTSAPLIASETGAFVCQLKPEAAPPLALVAIDPAGLREPMVSLTTLLPAAGNSGTVNISPLTTAIAAQLAPNKDAFALVRDPTSLAALDTATVNAVKANVARQLAAVLISVGLDPATFDLVSTAFVGGSNAGADKMLDQVRVTFENGDPVLSNVLTPDVPPVPMADATTTSPLPIAASTTPDFSVVELDIFKTQFEACFALPTAARPTATACTGLFVDASPTAAGATYRNSGLDAQAAFGGLLASSEMDGAKFNRPELMRYTPITGGLDQAVINLKFADKNGVGDNRVLTVKKYPGTESATRNSAWWLYGNQREVNAYIRASIRKQEQLLPEAFHAQYDVAPSRFQTGLEIFVARDGFGPNTAGLRYVRVKGPGLPTAGLVLSDVAGLPQNWMSIFNATGVIPTDKLTTTNSNNIFYLQRSRGITGADAFALRPNPSITQATPAFNNWAHPAMYGETASGTWQFDLSKVPSWSRYTFELFYEASPGGTTEVTPRRTFTSSITTPVVPAASAAVQQWNDFPADTRALATNGAPAAATLQLNWLINPYAQRIESVNVYSFDSKTSATVNSPSTGVPKGASSQAVTAAGGASFPALTTDHRVSRTLQWRYKALDGSYKDQTLTFN